jgi:hypothetical protein
MVPSRDNQHWKIYVTDLSKLRKEVHMSRKRRPQRRQPLPSPERGLPPETNPRLRDAILEVVDTQLSEGDPPETRQTFDRLVADGYSPEGARQLIAHVVVHEIFAVLARGEQYNQVRFLAGLKRLPRLEE